MFKNSFQSGFLSILYSIGSKPLQIWDKTGKLYKNYLYRFNLLFMNKNYFNELKYTVKNGHIKRLTD